MPIFNAAGVRFMRSELPIEYDVPDPEVLLTEDLYKTTPYDTVDTSASGGSIRTLLGRAGTVIRQSDLDKHLRKPFTITGLSPADGPLAQGATITVAGDDLAGVAYGTVTTLTAEGVATTSDIEVVTATDSAVTFALPVAVAAGGSVQRVLLADLDNEVEFPARTGGM